MTTVPADDFDWSADDSVIVREQKELAVYLNDYGQVVLRERESWPGDDGDPYILIDRHHARAVARAILRAAGMEQEESPKVVGFLPPPGRPAAQGKEPTARSPGLPFDAPHSRETA